MFAALLGMALLQSNCGAPTGTASLLQGDQRFIVIGETHGSEQTPAAFGAIVCEASAIGPVTVALELPNGMQPQLDGFMNADSDATALAALADTPFLDPTMIDGRTSQAMLAMMQSLRRLKAKGRDIALRGFQPSSSIPRELPQSYYELEMGYLLSRAVVDRPGAMVFGLVGNLHARKSSSANFPNLGLPASAHLPADQTLTLEVAPQGGEAWTCRGGCGPHSVGEGYDVRIRGVILESSKDGAYDGLLALGPLTFSPPISAPQH